MQNTAFNLPFCVRHVGYASWVETSHIELLFKKVGRIVAERIAPDTPQLFR